MTSGTKLGHLTHCIVIAVRMYRPNNAVVVSLLSLLFYKIFVLRRSETCIIYNSVSNHFEAYVEHSALHLVFCGDS